MLDFGCGVGRWVPDLPRPYLGLDLLPEHLDLCRNKYADEFQIEFHQSSALANLPAKGFNTIFTCTVLQHIVEKDRRKQVLSQLSRLLADDGIFLCIEWAEGQRQYDWCQAVTRRELNRWFAVQENGTVVESGRKHSVWLCHVKKHGWELG